ncbi:MAG: EamA family transporter [Alphaproteobacteria bacterium]
MPSFFWFFIAFLAPFFHAWCNIIDCRLSNGIFKRISPLVFYTYIFYVILTPFVCLIEMPQMLPLNQIWIAALIGFINVGYLFPYYASLKKLDTSIVTALFSLGQIIIPVLAWFFLDERLATIQYLGFFIIIFAACFLTLEKKNAKLKINKAFFYMLFCSLLLSFSAILCKHLFNVSSWSTGFVWYGGFSFLFSSMFLLIPRDRRLIFLHAKVFKKNFYYFALEEFLNFCGTAAGTYALSKAPVVLYESVSATQPFFILFYVLILRVCFPKVFLLEKTNRWDIIKKILSFILIMIGIGLVFNDAIS